jgi:hypothetical protein
MMPCYTNEFDYRRNVEHFYVLLDPSTTSALMTTQTVIRMKHQRTILLVPVLAVIVSASQVMSAAICGTVEDVQGQAVKDVSVMVKNPSTGSTLGHGTTDNNGIYHIDHLDMGTVNLFIAPNNSAFQSGSGVLNLNSKSKRVDWRVSGRSSAVASQAGDCGESPIVYGGGTAVLGGAAAAGLTLTPVEEGAVGVLGLGAITANE